MNKWSLFRFLIIIGLSALDIFLVWALYSMIMLLVLGANTLSVGTIVLGGILLFMFGGLVIIGILITSAILLGLIFGVD